MASEPHVFVEKVWGEEEWIVNNALYCGKVLRLRPGFQCSLHYHPVKTETFYVQDGVVALELQQPARVHKLVGGESLTIPAGTPHRFWALNKRPATVLEFSTPHSDSDVVRLEESGPLNLGAAAPQEKR